MLRNRRRHGEAGMPIRQAVLWVRDTAYDLWHLLHPQKEKAPKVLPRWKPPDEGWIKCNSDGPFYSDGKGATGAVLRDHLGCFRRGFARWYDTCMDALTMEALACRDGLILVMNYGATRVVLETDCYDLVRLWSLKDEQRSSVTSILREIQELCNSLVGFSLCYASRECNLVAHVLAKQMSSVCVMGVWYQAPSCVQGYLMSDCNAPPDQ